MVKRLLQGGAVAAVAAVLAMPAFGGNGGPNPSQICSQAGDFGMSHGACVSSVAQGFDGENGVPSRAAFVDNCKQLEENEFVASQERPYPYAFYGNAHRPEYVAKNRADCVRILYALHTGQLAPGPQP